MFPRCYTTPLRSIRKPMHMSSKLDSQLIQKVVAVPARSYDIPLYHHHRQAFVQQVRSYAERDITPVDLPSLIASGQETLSNPDNLVDMALFLYHELPTRLAKCIDELAGLPYGLSDTPSITQVRLLYESSFRDIVSCLPPTRATEPQFLSLLERILWRHNPVVPLIAQSILSKKRAVMELTNGAPCPYISTFLDGFYMARISIRMLISQYIALHYPQEGYCGNIAMHLNPIPIIRQAVDDASSLCERNYGAAPSVDISFTACNIDQVHDVTYGVFPQPCSHEKSNDQSTNTNNTINTTVATTTSVNAGISGPDPSVLSVSYVPNHLHHIMFELTKNSMRAVVERYGAHHADLPSVQVLLVSGADDFSIRISDRGGGFPLQHSPRLFSWLHTTASPRAQQALMRMQFNADTRTHVYKNSGVGVQRILSDKLQQPSFGNPDEGLLDRHEPTPIAGFGYGLPLSRLFGRFFGGDIRVRSMPGHGVDAHVYLPKLDHNKTQL